MFFLQELFGLSLSLMIATSNSLKPTTSPTPDKLFFTFAKNGEFSVKKAYQLLKVGQASGTDKAFWNWVWEEIQVIPKLKVFLRRAIQGALPVKVIIAVRIQHVSATCTLCNQDQESVTHCLFHCDFARRVWLISDLGLRTENLNGSFREIAQYMRGVLTGEQASSWAIWRSRNEAVFKSTTRSLGATNAFYKKA